MKPWMAMVAAVLSFSQGVAADQAPEQIQQLVAPIALYPDELVAQILAASTRPDQVVQADRWMQAHPNLSADRLARKVDKQPWDPSVKALTQFPSVLANLDQSLSWTSALGDAYADQPQAVLDAVQAMRQRALDAGTLQSTPQQVVTTEGQTIAIEPANAQVVYVPAYDPWRVYGPPLVVYPGWVPLTGVYMRGPGMSFGIGLGVGTFGGFGWGWNHWRTDWHGRRVIYDQRTYVAHRPTFTPRTGFRRAPVVVNHGRRFQGGFHGGGHHR
jgi:hypothetical protein